VLGGVFNAALMNGVPQIVANALQQVEGLPHDEKLKILVQTARAVQSEMPPRENQRINISLESVHASGPLGAVQVVLRGACNYKQTGLLQAYTRTTSSVARPAASDSRRPARHSATASCSPCSRTSAWRRPRRSAGTP